MNRYDACIALFSIMITTSSAVAVPMTFNFNGIVQDNSEKTLFPGRSIGDSYTGTFTVDSNAPVIQDFGNARDYDGAFFGVTVDGTSYSVHIFNVWLDGIEFDIMVNGDIAFLSLRSTTNLYNTPDVPTSFEIGEFDDLARITLYDSGFSLDQDRGSVLAISSVIPEPTAFILIAVGSIAMVWPRRAV